ncbi:hypothetical protein ABMA28_003077 [Loxostege sticticalis]|uniref:Integrase catalytic domain-containing protein n=1 Tax=Loxostege sticticalis TaxID=481309 RepID=A0ABD0SUY9_LOXSC
MPQFVVNTNKLNVPPHVSLADDEFYKCDKISMLLGCDVFFQVLLREQLPVVPGELFLQNTRFGYVVAGIVRHSKPAHSSCVASNFCSKHEVHFAHNYDSDIFTKLDQTVSQFWQTEKVPEVYTEADSEQELAEQIFQDTVLLKDNKFEVSLPLKQDISTLRLGDSLTPAHKRFLNLELRFKRDEALFLKYKDFIDEFVELGHAKYVDISSYNLDEQAVFFMPHHPVFNENSETTKLRVVFDASMQTYPEKISLNHVLLNGAVVQQDLFSILVLFRLYKFIINCDITKMFKAISLTPSHRPLQNILWRPSPNDDIKCLQLQTVTYGQKSSSFLATRCLLELVHRFRDQYPLAADALLYKTYVDDINLSSNDINELLESREQLIELLSKGGFSLHKWCANKIDLLKDIPENSQHKRFVHFTDNKDSMVRTLGMKCELCSDTFVISSPQYPTLEKYTKRDVLSFVSKIFDPLGLAGPIVVNAKLLMQQTWLLNIGWDCPLPSNLYEDFRKFADSLNKMQNVVVKRNLDTQNAKSIDIVGFSDASNLAYGCCLYLRIVDTNGNVNVDLLCSKSRVNPIKKSTTPRAELNGALLLAKLVKKVYDIIQPRFDINVCLFVDSQVVLAWLITDPLKLGVYIANRVKCITELTKGFSWHYVNTVENPADCLSRGVEPHLLQKNLQWFHGPSFLKQLDFQPQSYKCEMPREIPELKASNVVQRAEELPLFTRFSSIDKIKRILAYVYRFVNNCKSKTVDRIYGNLTPQELNHSLIIILRCEQTKFFSEEITCLNTRTSIKSNLKALNPFLDSMNVLRVGGRLQHADIPYSTKHPIILPKRSKIVHYLIEKEHRILLHAGPKHVFSNLSLKYHIVNGIREVKHVLHKCTICFRLKAKHAEQLMGSLPSDRVNPCRAFEKVGIDYGGPFSIKMLRARKPVIQKAYIVLFVCFTTKAIHVELASDLTTDCFLNSLKRFIARRNKPLIIYCDNASTFKGAQNQLNSLYKLHCSSNHINSVEAYAADNGITFKYIPTGIKSCKYHLKRVVGNAVLTYEELNTVIIQIEGILNSRPLTALPTTDLHEMPYLTPGHFLTGAPITSYPEEDYTNVPCNRLKFWKQCTQMVQQFWKQWHKQYLVQLQSRPKWRNECNNIKIGTLVLVREDNIPPLKWPMARVVDVFPGADGKVRALSIRTSKGAIIKTSIYKVCVLPFEDNM